MGLFTTTFFGVSFGSALSWSALRHIQLRRGPRRLHWSGSVLARNGYSASCPVSSAKIMTSVAVSPPSGEAGQQKKSKKHKKGGKKKTLKSKSQTDEEQQQQQQQQKQQKYKLVEKEVSFVPTPNSLPALQYAVEQHATGVQVQVRLCASGELVLFGGGPVGDTMELVSNRLNDADAADGDHGGNPAAEEFEKWEDNPEEDEELVAQALEAEAESKRAQEAYNQSLLLDEKSFAQRRANGVESFTLNELRCLTYKADPARSARVLTVEECVDFCRENGLRIVFEPHVAGFGAARQNSRSGGGAFSAWSQRRADRKVMATQFANLYGNNRLEMLKFLRDETLVISNDPALLYRIRESDQKIIPVGVVSEPHLWTGRVPVPPPAKRQASAAGKDDGEPALLEGKAAVKQSRGEKVAAAGRNTVSAIDDALDRALAEINERVTPWIVGASCVTVHRNCFSRSELQKWRSRDMLVCVTGFSDDPYQLPIELTADIEGTCILADGEYIKFFP